MKNLVLGSLIAALASQAAGCIIESNNDTYVSASWSIKHLANNTVVPCPPGYNTAALYSQPVNPDLTLVGSPTVDLFDCVANQGTSGPLAPGLYLEWVEIANDNDTSVYAKSLSTPIDTTNGDQPANFTILEDGGYFQMQWLLKGASSNATLSCAQAGASGGVELTATLANTSSAASDQFDCENNYGVTDPYIAGDYTVSVAALNAADQSIGTAPAINSRIDFPNKVTNLGTVTVPITGM